MRSRLAYAMMLFNAFFSSGMWVINSNSSSNAVCNARPVNGNASAVTTATAAPDFYAPSELGESLETTSQSVYLGGQICPAPL